MSEMYEIMVQELKASREEITRLKAKLAAAEKAIIIAEELRGSGGYNATLEVNEDDFNEMKDAIKQYREGGEV